VIDSNLWHRARRTSSELVVLAARDIGSLLRRITTLKLAQLAAAGFLWPCSRLIPVPVHKAQASKTKD
jgi:hypothetical protein